MICWKCLSKVEDHGLNMKCDFLHIAKSDWISINNRARADRFIALVAANVAGLSAASAPKPEYVIEEVSAIMANIERRVEAGTLFDEQSRKG